MQFLYHLIAIKQCQQVLMVDYSTCITIYFNDIVWIIFFFCFVYLFFCFFFLWYFKTAVYIAISGSQWMKWVIHHQLMHGKSCYRIFFFFLLSTVVTVVDLWKYMHACAKCRILFFISYNVWRGKRKYVIETFPLKNKRNLFFDSIITYSNWRKVFIIKHAILFSISNIQKLQKIPPNLTSSNQ